MADNPTASTPEAAYPNPNYVVAEVYAVGFIHVDHVATFDEMPQWNAVVELIRPQIGILPFDDTDHPMPMEMMTTKAGAMQQIPDMIEQHNLLTFVAGHLRAIVAEVLWPIDASNMRKTQNPSSSHSVVQKEYDNGSDRERRQLHPR